VKRFGENLDNCTFQEKKLKIDDVDKEQEISAEQVKSGAIPSPHQSRSLSS